MKCPIDGNTLVMSERRGVEIDYCPECRGVWLDRGELDKIIERSESPGEGATEGEAERAGRRVHKEDDDWRKRHRKKRSFLSDIFEFGGD